MGFYLTTKENIIDDDVDDDDVDDDDDVFCL